MYACICKAVRYSDIEQMVEEGISSGDELIEVLQLDDDDCCGRCVLLADRLVQRAGRAQPRSAREPAIHPVVSLA